jgi:branched-chain amino acid transport system substrate-binding protein
MPTLSQLLLNTCVLGFCLLLTGCPEEEQIRVGYVGGLTGRVAGLGVAGRDGAMLAIEEQNQRGGIDGRRLVLIVRDDRQDPETAKQVIEELIAADVAAIIGPMTSSMAVAMLPLVNQAGIVMISPTVKTDMLSAQDDYFFRVTTPLSINVGKIVELAVGELGLKQFAVVYDDSNRAFTKTWLDHFKSFAEPLGGHFGAIESFRSGPEVSFLDLAENIIATDPQGILILASAMDTALFSQQVRKL